MDKEIHYYSIRRDGMEVERRKKKEDITEIYNEECNNHPKAKIDVVLVVGYHCWGNRHE